MTDRLDPLRAALRADAANLARALLGEPNRALSSKRTLRFGTKGSLAVEISGPKRGLWFTHEGDEGSDLLGLIRHAHGCSFPDAVDYGRRFTGLAEVTDDDREDDERRRAESVREREQRRAEADAEALKEAARQLRDARRIAAETTSIEGTLGCHYLRQIRGIPRPAGGWPDTVRWHARLRAVVVVATLPDGTVQRVQRIHLAEDGGKIGDAEQEARNLRAVKLTNGPQRGGAVVRLSGDPAGPLLLAEGPETALAAWSSTGHETWITLGSMGKAEPPAGRPIVVCRDDDKRHSPGDTAHSKMVAGWRKAGLDVRVATPWPMRRQDKSDLASVILADGADAVAGRVRLALSRAGADPSGRVDRDTARNLVGAAVAGFFAKVDALSAARAEWGAKAHAATEGRGDPAEPRRSLTTEEESAEWDAAFAAEPEPPEPSTFTHAVRVDVGIGKSHEARHGIARTIAAMRARITAMRDRGDDRAMVLAVPAHALGDEQAAAFLAIAEVQAAGLRVDMWRGRAAPDPDHPDYRNPRLTRDEKTPMCGDLERVLDAQSVGLAAQESVCFRKLGEKGNKTVHKCPLFETCAYQQQQNRKADLWVISHDLLFHEKPAAIGDVAAVVVDEAIWRKGLLGAEGRPITLSLDTFDQDVTVKFETSGMIDHALSDRLRDLRRQLGEMVARLPNGPVKAADLCTDLTADSCAEAWKAEWLRKVITLHPGQTREQRKEAVERAEGNRTIARMGMVWDALRILLSPNAPAASGWIELGEEATKDGPVRVVRLKGRSKIKEGWKAPTLLLDALLPIDLVRFFWPDAEMVADVRAAMPHQHIRQVTDRAYALSRLEPLTDEAAKADPEEAKRRRKCLRDLRAFLIREAQRHAPGRVLVVLQQAVERALHESGRLPSNLETAHHNAVAGRDEWKDVASVIVVGRTLPPPSGVERIAEALTGRAVAEPLEWYMRGDAVREMADGSTMPAEAETHSDPLAEVIRWQIAEGELVQIIGRGRGVNRTEANPLDVLVLTDAPLPMPLAGTLGAADLAPGPADLMMAAGGVVLENPADIAATYPELWGSSRDTIKSALRRGKLGAFPYRESIIGECTQLRRVAYKVKGQGKSEAAGGFWPDLCPDPEAFLVAKLGALAWCRIEGKGGSPSPPPKGGEAHPAEVEPEIARHGAALSDLHDDPMPTPEPAEPGHPAWLEPPSDPAWDGRWLDAADPDGDEHQAARHRLNDDAFGLAGELLGDPDEGEGDHRDGDAFAEAGQRYLRHEDTFARSADLATGPPYVPTPSHRGEGRPRKVWP